MEKIWDAGSKQVLRCDARAKADNAESRSVPTLSAAHGAVVLATDAEGETTENDYDVRDRLHTSTDANGLLTEYEYDKNNNLLSLTDPKNATRSWTYDARNLKVS